MFYVPKVGLKVVVILCTSIFLLFGGYFFVMLSLLWVSGEPISYLIRWQKHVMDILLLAVLLKWSIVGKAKTECVLAQVTWLQFKPSESSCHEK